MEPKTKRNKMHNTTFPYQCDRTAVCNDNSTVYRVCVHICIYMIGNVYKQQCLQHFVKLCSKIFALLPSSCVCVCLFEHVTI